MNKSELIDAAADRTDQSKADVAATLDVVLETIQDAVKRGDRVSLTGFGTFERRERAARTGRNPQTGSEMKVRASKVPAFKAGKKFKDAVDQ